MATKNSQKPRVASLPSPRTLVQLVYNRALRPHLPRKLAMCNGVVARRVKLLDSSDHRPEYERALLAAIRLHVKEGETVVEVGGGFGVASVAAARQVGASGEVLVHEAAAEQVPRIEETAELNDVSDRIHVRQALVGPGDDVWGSAEGADILSPTELPDGDTLVLDCEGAEAEIVPPVAAAGQYGRIIVVAHECFGVSVPSIRDPLTKAGYEIVSEEETEGSAPATLLVAEL